MVRARPKLTLTEFMDIVVRSGIPKATATRAVKANDTYSPQADFYKALREHIVEVHRSNQPKANLKALLPTLTDDKKVANYPGALKGYAKWWGTKALTWFTPPSTAVSRSGVDVTITPELGLVAGGVRHVIKLYLRSDSLPQNRADIVLRLIEGSLASKLHPGEVVGILDVRRGRLLTPSGKNPTALLDALLDAEFAYIATLWPAV